MLFEVKKNAVVFFMLVAFATQTFVLALTSNMPVFMQHMSAEQYAAPEHSMCVEADDLVCMNKIVELSCCDGSAECSVVHCYSLAACAVCSFCSGTKVAFLSLSTSAERVLPIFAVSLYRPPIFPLT